VKFYVCELVGMLIKWLYEMHGATIKITIKILIGSIVGHYEINGSYQHVSSSECILR